MAWASLTRWRCPVLIVPTGRNRSSPETDLPQGIAGPRRRLPAGQAVQLGQVPDHVVGGHVGGQSVMLGGVTEAGPHLGAGHPRVLPEHGDGTAVRSVQPEDQAEQRGLAGSVGAEQPGDPVADVERGAGQSLGGRPAFRHVDDCDDRGHWV